MNDGLFNPCVVRCGNTIGANTTKRKFPIWFNGPLVMKSSYISVMVVG